ncbi:MAG: hypothetical protein K0S55_1959, partial [Clostridia bacterium]|nr:hypothetical protein [Clostridia bacterium]
MIDLEKLTLSEIVNGYFLNKNENMFVCANNYVCANTYVC